MLENGHGRWNVDLRVFSVGAEDYGIGTADFDGELEYPLPVCVQDETDRLIVDWGCGVFATRNTLALMGIRTTTRELTMLALKYGMNKVGSDGDVVWNLFRHYGIKAREKKIATIGDISLVTDGGGVVLTTVISHDWTKADRSSWQTFDSHWVVIPAADSRRVMVMDSELREEGVGKLTYGTYTMPWRSFSNRNFDYWLPKNGGFTSVSEDYVWGESIWYHNDVLVVSR